MVCAPKITQREERIEYRDVPEKTQERPEKQPYLPAHGIRLPNDALADPLGVRGSNLVQQKGINADNGLRPKRY